MQFNSKKTNQVASIDPCLIDIDSKVIQTGFDSQSKEISAEAERKVANEISTEGIKKHEEAKDNQKKAPVLIQIKKAAARLNGFECPLSFLQVLSWVITLFILVSFVLTTSALLIEKSDHDSTFVAVCIAFSTLYAIAFTSMVVTTVIVTASDPSDPTVNLNRLHRETIAAYQARKADEFVQFDEMQFKFYCAVCETHVLPDTKHCQYCNRCTYEFDHHCLWVNNDIGLQNYAAFLRMLSFLMLTLITQLAFASYVLVYVSKLDSGNGLTDSVQIGFMSGQDLAALNFTTIVIVLVLMTLDTYLICFHVKLISKNLTTYKHIRAGQQRKSRIIQELQRGEGSSINQGRDSDDQNEPSQSDSGLNANSVYEESQASVDAKKIKSKDKTKRATCREVFCFAERHNRIRKKILDEGQIVYGDGQKSFGISEQSQENRKPTPRGVRSPQNYVSPRD